MKALITAAALSFVVSGVAMAEGTAPAAPAAAPAATAAAPAPTKEVAPAPVKEAKGKKHAKKK